MKKLRSDFERRQYMIRKDYEIFFYSDIRFQNVQPHTHDYYEFYFPISEHIEMEVAGDRFPIGPECLVIVPPKTVHRAVSKDMDTPYKRFVFWISKDLYDYLGMNDPECTQQITEKINDGKYLFRFSENEMTSLHAKILRLMDEDKADRYGKRAFTDLCIRDLLLTMNRLVYEKEAPAVPGEQQLRLLDIKEYIDEHLEEDLSLEKLSHLFFVSKHYITHRFHERLGITVHQYILKRRLEKCAAAIRTGRNITSVYTEYGFKDYTVFYRAFKKEYGVSPKEYRKAAENHLIYD